MHAFLALVLVSLIVALVTRIPLGDVVSTLTTGFGATLASVALLVGLGAMLGRLLEFSGGAQVLADSLVRRFGEQRAALALGVAACCSASRSSSTPVWSSSCPSCSRTPGASGLKTWTVMETLLGTLGFVFALLLSLLL